MHSRSRDILALFFQINQLVLVVVVTALGASGVLAAVELADLVIWQAWWAAVGSRQGVWLCWRRQRGAGPPRRPWRSEESTPDDQARADDGASEPPVPRPSLADPQRWGLSLEQCAELPDLLWAFWQSLADCFRTKTRDGRAYAYHYVSGLLRMEGERNFSAIGRALGVPGENIQHFMSHSPWSSQAVIERLHTEIMHTSELGAGAVLLLDESADEKAGDHAAGAARQYNGRLGKVDLSQVGVYLAYANTVDAERPFWAWIDGRLYLPEHWFEPALAEHHDQAGVPDDLVFKTKVQLGWEMIERALARGLPFEAVMFDDLYGRSGWLRDQISQLDGVYMADVPCSTLVYLQRPELGVPAPEPGTPGRPPTRIQVLNAVEPVAVQALATDPGTH